MRKKERNSDLYDWKFLADPDIILEKGKEAPEGNVGPYMRYNKLKLKGNSSPNSNPLGKKKMRKKREKSILFIIKVIG